MAKFKWDGVDRRKAESGNGRRICPMHDGMVKDTKDSVQWKVFVFIMMASMVIVGAGFGWFANDIIKVKDNQMTQIETNAKQTAANTLALAAMQKEILANVADNQRETRLQVEKIASQLESISKIVQVALNEISYLKRYDELDRQSKERLKR